MFGPLNLDEDKTVPPPKAGTYIIFKWSEDREDNWVIGETVMFAGFTMVKCDSECFRHPRRPFPQLIRVSEVLDWKEISEKEFFKMKLKGS